MSNVKIKNRAISLVFFLLLIGCNEHKEQKIKKQEVKKPLVFNV